MGDGPGYDYAASRHAEQAKIKLERQLKRLKLLTDMAQDVGFGDNDGNATHLEVQAMQHLTMAYELLSLITRKSNNG